MCHEALTGLLDGFFDGSVEELLRFLGRDDARANAAAAGEGDARIDTVLL